jgi:hypothetical protein
MGQGMVSYFLEEASKAPSAKTRVRNLRLFEEMMYEQELDDKEWVTFRVFFENAPLEVWSEVQPKIFSVLKKDKELEIYVNEQFEKTRNLYLNRLQELQSLKREWDAVPE